MTCCASGSIHGERGAPDGRTPSLESKHAKDVKDKAQQGKGRQHGVATVHEPVDLVLRKVSGSAEVEVLSSKPLLQILGESGMSI